MKKVKKGSSLLFVVVVFAVLTILGFSIMSVTITDCNLRAQNNQRVQNLYGADSGLTKAYDETNKFIQNSIKKANKKVYEENQKSMNKTKVVNGKTINVGRPLTYDEKNSIFKRTYKEQFFLNNDDNIVNCIENGDFLLDLKSQPKITILNKKGMKFISDKLDLNIQSKFKYKDINRIVACVFNIDVPDYGKLNSYESKRIEEKEIWSKSFVAGKNFENNSNLNINGDVYVFGKSNKNQNGIILNNNSKFDFSGNLVTCEDIFLNGNQTSLKTNGKNDKQKNNIYTGSLKLDKSSNNADVNIKGSIYANNDLSLSGQKSNVNISNFYGINDKGSNGNLSESDREKNSSSIIINSNDIGKEFGSKLSINDNAILMGTAYVKTNPSYQTGESVGIKGNYRAYAQSLNEGKSKNESLNKENIKFEYREPVQFATQFKDGKKLLYDDKSNYLNEYLKENPNSSIINNGGQGINLPKNTIHVGAIFNNGKFENSNYKLDDNVEDKINIYNNAVNMQDINDEIDFTSLKNANIKEENSGYQNIIYLNNEDKDCVLNGENSNLTLDNNFDVLDVKRKTKGLIITKGNVYVNGKIDDFEGTIIAGGNIIFNDNKKKNFMYDEGYIKKAIAEHSNLFNGVFIGKGNGKKYPIKVLTNVGNYENLVGQYDIKNILLTKKWRIIK